MKWERRVPLPWLVAGALVICVWCSFLSGIGGWLMGKDLATREQRALYETEIATHTNLPQLGVLVTRTDRGSPAERAGIQRGDTIIAINSVQIQDVRDLRDQLREFQPGNTVQLTVLHDQGEADLSVRLDPFPGNTSRAYLGVYYTARADEPADL